MDRLLGPMVSEAVLSRKISTGQRIQLDVVGGEMTAPGAPSLINFAPPGNPDDERAVFTRLKNHEAAGITYTVEFSADLKIWTTSHVTQAVLTDENSAGDHEIVSVPFSGSAPVEGGGDELPPAFMQVTVSMD